MSERAKQIRDEWHRKHEESQKATLRNYGFKVENLTQDQIDIIMMPFDAPENYMCDGELTKSQAKQRWEKSLIQSGINGSDLIRALKFIK